MSGLWRKTLIYLGLVEEPEDHDDLHDHYEPVPAQQVSVPQPEPVPTRPSNVRPLRGAPEPGAAHVRPVPAGGDVRISVVTVREFDDVEQVGARFRNDQPVVIDLRLADTTVARRVLDFVSGMTYAMRGRLTGAGNRTFLLTPDGVELTPEERRRIEDLALRGEA